MAASGKGAPISAEASRADRRNQSAQLRRNKHIYQLALRRAAKFGGPQVVGVIALSARADLKGTIQSLVQDEGTGAGAKFVSALGIQTDTSVAGRPVTADFPTCVRALFCLPPAVCLHPPSHWWRWRCWYC